MPYWKHVKDEYDKNREVYCSKVCSLLVNLSVIRKTTVVFIFCYNQDKCAKILFQIRWRHLGYSFGDWNFSICIFKISANHWRGLKVHLIQFKPVYSILISPFKIFRFLNWHIILYISIGCYVMFWLIVQRSNQGKPTYLLNHLWFLCGKNIPYLFS